MSRPGVVALIVVLLASAAIAAKPHVPDHSRTVTPISRQGVAYEVKLGFIGYTGLARSIDCDGRTNPTGYDSLVGVVKGVEVPGEKSEDVRYTGRLKRITKIDYCQARGRRSATDDEVVWCVATLTGGASMDVEITVSGDSGAGAYVKAQPVGPPDAVSVTGNCTQAGMDSIRVEYPSGGSGASPSGQPIEESSPARFVVNGVVKLRVGYHPPDRDQDGWGLRIVRQVSP